MTGTHYLVVIGGLSEEQYESARQEMIAKGMTPKIARVTEYNASFGDDPHYDDRPSLSCRAEEGDILVPVDVVCGVVLRECMWDVPDSIFSRLNFTALDIRYIVRSDGSVDRV